MGERIRVMRVITGLDAGGPALQALTLLDHLDPGRFEQRLYTTTMHERARTIPDDSPRALARLVAEMRRFRPDIVHTHTARAGALGRMAATMARVPARVHTFDVHPRRPTIERRLARVSDRLVADCALVRDDLLAAGVGTPRQYAVVRPGVRTGGRPAREVARARLGLPADIPVVAFVGKVTKARRPDRFLDTVALVLRGLPMTRVLVCGGGDLAADLRAKAVRFGDAVAYLSRRTDHEIIHAAADVMLLTSDYEGIPLDLLKAAASGVPAVATRVGGVPEVVEDRVTGLLTDPDPGLLAASVVRILRDPGYAGRLGDAAAQRAGLYFGQSRFVDDLSALYLRLHEESRSGSAT
ncbi:glycosyltransferase [Herbidospora yilanensis]|uniref:glycosyltransferase n=1 Tax=Herbidospora yilanensis TaxID=354426 RepID=UPI000785B5FC|nr:glycosyltransferase [Herbidospora yilanensis]